MTKEKKRAHYSIKNNEVEEMILGRGLMMTFHAESCVKTENIKDKDFKRAGS